MLPAFLLSCSEMINQWKKFVYKEGSCELDIWSYLEYLSADVISRTAFGSNYQKGTSIFQLQKKQARPTPKALRNSYFPGWR